MRTLTLASLTIALLSITARADLITQEQATSPAGVLVDTDWGPGTHGIADPLSFARFDPHQGTLNALTIAFTEQIRNDFFLNFTTASTLTLTTNDPRHGNLTGPVVTLFGPDGVPFFDPSSTAQPPDVRQVTASSGTYSSLLNPTDPHFLAPTATEATLTRTISDPATLAAFTGSGNVELPVTATAHSSFESSTGNGGGGVLTRARADVTLSYNYTPPTPPPAAVPEPATVVSLVVGIGMVLARKVWRKR
jgi:hypothetical protein